MTRMLFAVLLTFAAVVAAGRWAERNGFELPDTPMIPAVRTVELAASALRATLQPGPEAGVESEDRPQAPVAPEVESEVVVEVEIAADRAAPFVEVMPEGEPPAPVAAEAPEAPEPSRVTLERIDPNTSAALVRRMLAVYERMRNGG